MVGGYYNVMNLGRKMKKIKALIYTNIICGISSGKHTYIFNPTQIDNQKSIKLGSNVYVYDGGWLMGAPEAMKPTLVIEDNVQVGHFAHIIAMKNVCIEKNVLLADKVFISDCTHKYEDINIPVLNQGVSFIAETKIGEGTWLGENVCVCGASIGKHCVIGANSVVTHDIPDYSIAVGSPAKIIKRYDFESKKWNKI